MAWKRRVWHLTCSNCGAGKRFTGALPPLPRFCCGQRMAQSYTDVTMTSDGEGNTTASSGDDPVFWDIDGSNGGDQ